MKQVNLEDLEKGDFVIVKWRDASEMRARLEQHELPDVFVKDWGIYLGTTGVKKRYAVIGKDVVEMWNEWGAARIPIELINEIVLVMKREELLGVITEILALTRRIKLRRYTRRRW